MTGLAFITENTPIDGGRLLALTGEVDFSKAPELRQSLMDVISAESPRKLVIDMAGISYMDSSGVATLVEAMQAQRKGQRAMVLCGLQPRVRSVFEISRLDSVFTIVDSRDEALSA